jgi:vitamin B12 transporter
VNGGLEHTRQHIDSDTVYVVNTRTVDSARLGYNLDRGPHQLQLNVRKDRYSDFGSANTWLAGYGYQLTDAWRVSGMLSTGFNAPTFNDLFFPFFGNPALRPERVRSKEVGLQYAVAHWDLRATVFDNRFHDLIGSDAAFRTVNVGHAHTRGIELAYNGRFGDHAVHASLTSQDPRDLDTGDRLTRRADTLANVAYTRTLGAWKWGGDVRYVGRRPDAGTILGSYAVVDLTASYQLNPHTRLFGRIENAFDRQYETVFGYRQPGRGVFVGLTWQPKS